MDQDLIRKLKKIKNCQSRINPSYFWVAKTKEQILSQIANTACQENNLSFTFAKLWELFAVLAPKRMVYNVFRPVLMFVLVIGIAIGGWSVSVGATQNSLPGDIGWGVKLATEKISLAMTGSDEKEAEMNLEFASRRANEVKAVVKNKAEDETKDITLKATAAMQKLEESIDLAKNNIKMVGEDNPEKVVEVVKKAKEKTEEIKNTLKDAEKASNNEIDIGDTKRKVADASLEAVELIIQKQADGTVDVSAEEVKNMVKGEINSLLEQNGEVKAKAEATEGVLKEKVEAVNLLNQTVVSEHGKEGGLLNQSINSSLIAISSSTINDNIDTIKPIELMASTTEILFTTSTSAFASTTIATTTTDIKIIVSETSKKMEEVQQTAVKNLDEVKNLVDNNQLLEAIQKVREVNETTNKAEKAVNEVQKAVKEVVLDKPVIPQIQPINALEIDATTGTSKMEFTTTTVATTTTTITTTAKR